MVRGIGAITLGLALALAGERAQAGLITGSVGELGLGQFTGTATYLPLTPSTATLYIDLTNTSPPANGGFLTGFAMNLPGKHVLSVLLTTGPVHFEPMGGASELDSVNGTPFGQFDFGAAVGGSFAGSGTPSHGLAIGEPGHFAFDLTGNGLNTLTIDDFLNVPSAGPGDGQGNPGFVVRFDDVNPDGHHVPIDMPLVPNPEPSSLVPAGLAAIASTGLVLTRRFRRVCA